MKLSILGSSSSGNCYILQSDNEALIIEAGVSLVKAKQALGFNTSKVSGLIITHEHGDHSKYSKDYEKVFPVFTHKSVINARSLSQAKEIYPERGFKVGNFKVLPFKAHHDVDCLGFLINHSDFGNLMFLTDSFMCEYSFDNLNHILIESNYSDKALEESVKRGLHWKVRERVLTTHMSLQTTKQVLLNQNLSDVNNIVLLHLSSQNSDPEEIFNVIARATGKPISIAKTGLEIELSKNPY